MAAPEIDRLIQVLARLPGLGPRSARRAALTLIKRKESALLPLIEALKDAVEHVRSCSQCGNLDAADPVQASAATSAAIRRSCASSPTSPIYGHWSARRRSAAAITCWAACFSALDGVGPEQLNLKPLFRRIEDGRGERGWCWRWAPRSMARPPRIS